MPTSLILGKYIICRAGSDAESSTVIANGAVFQRDGVIEQVGTYEDLKASCNADEEIGGPNYVVFPGLVNSHHHGRGVTSLQMGYCDNSLETWILNGWTRRPHDHYLMTLFTAMQMIESGTTTVMYNHGQTPAQGLEDDLNEVLRAFDDVGMRTAFSVYYRGQNRVVYSDDQQFLAGLPADLAGSLRNFLAANDLSVDDYFSIFESLHRRYGSDPNSRVNILLSPSNVQWASDDFLQRTKELAQTRQVGIHMHLVESSYQKEFGVRTWGKTPVAHLQDLGFLGPELSCAHAVWLTEQDIDLLAGHGATVCHNASSNLRLKNGIAPVNAMASRGLNVAMGTDSTALNDDDDMIQEMRLVSKLHREPAIFSPAVSSHQVLAMATINAAAPTFFHDRIGALEVGRRADMVLLEMSAIEEPYMDPDVDIIDALLYRGKSRHIDTVLIDGRVVLRDGEFPGLSKADVAKELREQLARPIEPSVLEMRNMVQQLTPYVERFYSSWGDGEGQPHYRYNSRV